MRKLILCLVVLLVGGCAKPRDFSFTPGKYAIYGSKEQRPYIYDTLTNQALIELNDGVFMVDVTDATASNVNFGIAYLDITKRDLPLQLKNWRVNSYQLQPSTNTLDTIPTEISNEIITILPDQQLYKVSDNSLFGKTLVAIGPMRYISKTTEYYTFSLGINYVQVPISGAKIEKVDTSNSGQLTAEELAMIELAVGSLDMEQYAQVDTTLTPTIEQTTIVNPLVINGLDRTTTLTIENRNVYIVSIPQLGVLVPPLQVYIDFDNQDVIGFGIPEAAQ